MQRRLLEVLADPATGHPLALPANGDLQEGFLRTEHGRTFPIRAGIPRFVPPDPYAESFGLQWNKFAKVQLDSANGTTRSGNRFMAEVGWGPMEEGSWILDAGCGSGRFAEISSGLGAQVVALDMSSAVDAAQRNLSGKPNVHVVQGDLLQPPIRRGSLDGAYCIGVLQHTPDPKRALSAILSLLKPGAPFAVTMYARNKFTLLHSKYLVRPLTRRMRPARLLRAVESSMKVLFPVTDRLFRVPGLGRVARAAIPVANYVEHLEKPRDLRYQEAVLDTFDMLSPRYDQPLTPDDFEKALQDLGVGEYTFRSRIPINVVGYASPRSAHRRS